MNELREMRPRGAGWVRRASTNPLHAESVSESWWTHGAIVVGSSLVRAAGGGGVPVKHVHLCPKCHQRIVCDGDCAIEPDLGTTVHNLPHGATTRCDACGAPEAAPLDLDAIEVRANAATDGPWEAPDQLLIPCVRGVSDHGNTIRVCQFGWNNSPDAKRRDANNAVFIAHAREDVPALVAEVRRLRQCNEELVIERDEWMALAREHNDKRYAVLHRLRECTDPSGTGCVDCDAAPTCIDGDGALRCDDHRSQPRDGLDFNRDSQET